MNISGPEFDETRRPLPIGSESAVLLSPQLMARLERMELVSRKIFRGRMKGERRSRRKGQSVEFADFRAYVSGDDLRFIDWNLYARLDRLFLKLFLEEEDLHVFVVLDNSRSMEFGEPTKLRFSQQLAAALGFVALCRSDRVQIASLTSGRSGSLAPLRGRHSIWRLLSQLQDIQVEDDADLYRGIRDFSMRCPGRGIVVVISDLLEKNGFEPAFKHLIARDMDTYVVHLLAAEEVRPELTGDLKLLDSEDHDATDISISRVILDRYDQTVRSFLARAREYCVKRGIGYVFADTRIPIEELIQGHLAQRGLVR